MIKAITETFSPSGYEEKIIQYLSSQLSGVFDEVKTDNFGNLIAIRHGKGKSVCFECGMDSRGVMVVAKEDGKAYFSAVGSIKPELIVDKEIVFADGSFGTAKYDGENLSEAKISDLYIEMDTEKLSIGDFGVIVADFSENDDAFFANGIGDRIGVAAVCEAVKQIDKGCGFTLLFSAQKRLGGRGIRAFFGDNEFDTVITVDGSSDKCDGGCLLVVKDAKAVAPKELRNKAEEIAISANVPVTPVVSETNFFMETVSITGRGADCIGIGIPVQGGGKEKESVKKADFAAAVRLLIQIALNI